MVTAWTEHVKAYAAKNNVTYKEAMVAAKGTYTKPAQTAKAPAAPAADMPAKKPRAKSTKKGETAMPDKVKKAEKHDELKDNYEKNERVEEAKKVSKKKPLPLMV